DVSELVIEELGSADVERPVESSTARAVSETPSDAPPPSIAPAVNLSRPVSISKHGVASFLAVVFVAGLVLGGGAGWYLRRQIPSPSGAGPVHTPDPVRPPDEELLATSAIYSPPQHDFAVPAAIWRVYSASTRKVQYKVTVKPNRFAQNVRFCVSAPPGIVYLSNATFGNTRKELDDMDAYSFRKK